jgi:hypothetical protein
MPVLCEDDVLEERGDLVNGRNDGVTIRNGKRAAGTKVVLNVDNYEGVLICDSHKGHGRSSRLFVAYVVHIAETEFCSDGRSSRRERDLLESLDRSLHVRPACCIKAHVVMHRPEQIVNELRIIRVANEEVIQLPNVAVVLVLSVWFVFDSDWIPDL